VGQSVFWGIGPGAGRTRCVGRRASRAQSAAARAHRKCAIVGTTPARALGMVGRRRSRIGQVVVTVLLASLLLGLGSLVAIKQVPSFGPWLADSLRTVVGTEAVTCLEELSSKLEDGYHRIVRARAVPRTLEQAQPALSLDVGQPLPRPSPSSPSSPPLQRRAQFRPTNVPPMLPRVAASGDGQWRAVTDPFRPNAEPILFATLLHPDDKRPWAEVFVVAVAVSEIRLHAVAGTVEPEATTPPGKSYVRRGLIPVEHQSSLLAAFNGGFMTKHGRHGMHVDGVTLVSPRSHLCTLMGFEDGSLLIGTWKALEGEVQRAELAARLAFWRQGAPCMYEADVLNARLQDDSRAATRDFFYLVRRESSGP